VTSLPVLIIRQLAIASYGTASVISFIVRLLLEVRTIRLHSITTRVHSITTRVHSITTRVHGITTRDHSITTCVHSITTRVAKGAQHVATL
jgi:hypothetical protein